MTPCIKTKTLSIFLLIILLSIPLTSATSSYSVIGAELYKTPENFSFEKSLFTELSVKAEHYNQNLNKTPIILQRFVGSEQIDGKIKLENGSMLNVTLLMTGGKVRDFYSYGAPNDPDLVFEPSILVETDEQTVRKILDSEDPLREAVKGMNDNSFKVEPNGFFRKATLWTARQLYS
jgi:hypothetical protein